MPSDSRSPSRPAAPAGRKRQIASPHPMKGAILGYGFIASQGHLPAWQRRALSHGDLEIVAVADRCEARRALAHQALPAARIYADHRSLLAAEGTSLDFVDICTPPSEHACLTHDALDRGLHVLCEKPMAVSAKEAASMIAHAQLARRVLMPCHNYLHAPVIRAVREVLDSGLIGRVHALTLDTFRPTHARGVAEWSPDWRRDRHWSGGGIAMDHGPHTLYLAFDWMNSLPTSVSARTFTDPSGKLDTEDTWVATLTFPTGLASAFLTWKAGLRKGVFTIHGDRGAIVINDDELQIVAADAPAGGPASTTRPRTGRLSVPSDCQDARHSAWFEPIWPQFLDAIAADRFVGKDALDAVRTIQVIEAAYVSAAHAGQQCPLDLAQPLAVQRPRLLASVTA
ncbi:MAG: Gfo/Idh/MocA family oxidoreductase [Deltaproteobacteria bacterium]|nr:Gfo/Idh/MocA family oxidoreductase [Deltaproteobacteria bacterium]